MVHIGALVGIRTGIGLVGGAASGGGEQHGRAQCNGHIVQADPRTRPYAHGRPARESGIVCAPDTAATRPLANASYPAYTVMMW